LIREYPSASTRPAQLQGADHEHRKELPRFAGYRCVEDRKEP
jgi:hypothetical protein